jgi:hypothetical protein
LAKRSPNVPAIIRCVRPDMSTCSNIST